MTTSLRNPTNQGLQRRSNPTGQYRGDPWRFETAESIRSSVLSAVLPDGDAEDLEQHPWALLAELIGRHGVTVDAEALKSIPYRVEFGERLQRRLDSIEP